MIDLGKAKYFPLWRLKGQPKMCSYWAFPLFYFSFFSLLLDFYGFLLFGHNLSTGFPPTYGLWITLENRYNQSSENE